LRVATFSSACRIRELALRRLDEAGIRWCEVFVGGGILAVGRRRRPCSVGAAHRALRPAASMSVHG
jgi:hypothetical protein